MDYNLKSDKLAEFYPLRDRKLRFETLQIHGGAPHKDPATNAKAVPIYQTTSFVFENSDHIASVFQTGVPNVYSRMANPTVDIFEKRVAALQGGVAAVAAASGQAASFMALSCLARSGDNIVSSSYIFTGTHSQLEYLFERYGIIARFAPRVSLESMEALIDDRTRAIYCEIISNPGYIVPDIPLLAEIAHRHGIPLVVDNTFGACGAIARPLDLGADIVVESATKWIGGHGTTIGGVIVDGGRFDWAKSTKFPIFTKVIKSKKMEGQIAKDLVGRTFYETYKEKAFAMKVRFDILRDVGACMTPECAWMLLQGLETLSLRVERHLSNTMAVARYLDAHPMVAWVSYPGLPSHESHETAKRLLKGFGCVLGFGVKGGRSEDLMSNLKLHSVLVNVGDVHSLIIHPASITRHTLDDEERLAGGITPDMLRVSVGTEHIDDIIEDFEIAFAKLDEDIKNVQHHRRCSCDD